jgi:type IX secretion system PorP/SprF family membrane protein
MKTVLHRFVCATCFLLSTLTGLAQDIHFSQFFETPLLRNPALAGLFTGDLRLQAVYRTQWQSVTVPFQTTSLNGEYKLPIGKSEDFLTIGGQILHDKAGTVAMTSTHILPAVNYHKSLSADRNMYLSLGFMGGMVQRRIDRSKVTTNSQFDGSGFNGGLPDGENFTTPSHSYLDGTVGMSFNTQVGENQDNNVFVGVAYHHLNKPRNVSFFGDNNVTLAPKWVYSLGARMNATEFSYVTFHTDYIQQGPHSQFIGGMTYTYKLDDSYEPKYLIHAGGFIRWKDAIIPMAKVELRPLAISVSYDANVSNLSAASRGRGGFEMALSYQKYINRDNSSKDAVRCPRF